MRKAPFWVAVPESPEHGFPVEVTPIPEAGVYKAVATITLREPGPIRVRVEAFIARNEAGFAGRQWEMRTEGPDQWPQHDSQHATLREAAQALGREAVAEARLKAAMAGMS